MLVDEFISYIAGVRRYSARTGSIYADVLDEFRRFAAGDGTDIDDEMLISALTRTVIRNYEYHLASERKLSARTINQHLSVLSRFCRWLMVTGRLKSNPVKLVKRPKCEKRLPEFYREESMQKYFRDTSYEADEESAEELMSVSSSAHYGAAAGESAGKRLEELYDARLRRLIISILYETGMRRAELISLQVTGIDFSRAIITVTGKGDKMREIPMTSSLSSEISLYLKAAESVAGRKKAPGDPLLTTFGGRALYPMFVDRAVKKELGTVDDITGKKSPHVLRHTLATELLNDGADIYSIKELLGHSSLAATQVYTHNTIEKLKKVYNNAHPRAKRGGKNGD